jgi:hypothetical protein
MIDLVRTVTTSSSVPISTPTSARPPTRVSYFTPRANAAAGVGPAGKALTRRQLCADDGWLRRRLRLFENKQVWGNDQQSAEIGGRHVWRIEAEIRETAEAVIRALGE